MYSLRTALCENIRYQSKQNVRQDLIPRVRHGEAALMHPSKTLKYEYMYIKNLMSCDHGDV